MLKARALARALHAKPWHQNKKGTSVAAENGDGGRDTCVAEAKGCVHTHECS